MTNRILLCCLLMAAMLPASAQFTRPTPEEVPEENTGKFDPNRLVLGGNLGASFGDFTFVNISPQVGYMFKPWITAGAGVNFIYSSIKTRNLAGQEVARTNNGYAGMNVFARVFPVNFLFASVQPEMNYNWGKIKYRNSPFPDERLEGRFVPSLLVGAGTIIRAGGRLGMMVSLQYDVIQNVRSPYGTRPFVNVGFAM